MIKKFFILSAMIAFVAIFASCEKEETLTENNETSYVIPEVSFIGDQSGPLKASSTQWGSYPLLSSTGYQSKYFNAGTYAVKITRDSSDPVTSTFSLVAETDSPQNTAYVWAYKNDANNNQLYFSGVQKISVAQSAPNSPIPNISITGSQSVIYVFKVVSPGYYICWFRRL